MLAEIVARPKLAPLTVELPTQAKYKEEDNSNVEIKLEGDPEEKFKEFAVMYSHYGPNKKLYFSVFMTKSDLQQQKISSPGLRYKQLSSR